MIKINVIINNKNWFKFIKKPEFYINQKIKKINLDLTKFKKKKLFVLCYLEIMKLNI